MTVALRCHDAGMTTTDRRLVATIIVFLVVFIGSSLAFHPPLGVRALLAALCAGLAWILTPRLRS